MHYPDTGFDALIKKVKESNSGSEIKVIEKAYELAKEIHAGQKRLSGKDFTSHLLNTAFIVTEQKLDPQTISAALLHDALDERPELKPRIEEAMGKEIADLVEEMKRIDDIEEKNEGRIPEAILAKVIMGTAKDIRCLFIELSSRLDNLRGSDALPKKERNIMARAVKGIHAPVSHKLGLYGLEWELEDLSFKILQPETYYKIKGRIKETREERLGKDSLCFEKDLLGNNLLQETTIHEEGPYPPSIYLLTSRKNNGTSRLWRKWHSGPNLQCPIDTDITSQRSFEKRVEYPNS